MFLLLLLLLSISPSLPKRSLRARLRVVPPYEDEYVEENALALCLFDKRVLLLYGDVVRPKLFIPLFRRVDEPRLLRNAADERLENI